MENKKKRNVYPIIATEECKGCSRCVRACPKSVLLMDLQLNAMGYTHAIYGGDGCIGCGACFYACPEPGAITIVEESEDDK